MHETRIGRRAMLAGAATLAAPSVLRAQGALQKLTLLISTLPADPAFHVFYFAQAKGFYRAQGVDLEMVPTNGDATAVRVLLSGAADIASVGVLPSLQAVIAGTHLDIISCYSPKLDYLLVAAADIHGAKQLDGRTVAVSQIGATSHLVAQLLIKQGGGDPSKVNWLSVGASSTRVQALIAKRVQAAPLNGVFAARAAAMAPTTIVGDAVRDLPNFLYAWEMVTPRTLAAKKPALQGFVTGTAQAARWAVQNPDEAAAISRTVLPDQPPAEIDAAIKAFAAKTFWGTDGALDPAKWDFTISAMRDLGVISASPRQADLYFPEFSAAALKQLGPVPG